MPAGALKANVFPVTLTIWTGLPLMVAPVKPSSSTPKIVTTSLLTVTRFGSTSITSGVLAPPPPEAGANGVTELELADAAEVPPALVAVEENV
jgi:hypothetical protein